MACTGERTPLACTRPGMACTGERTPLACTGPGIAGTGERSPGRVHPSRLSAGTL